MSFATQQLGFELLNTSSIARIIKIAKFVGGCTRNRVLWLDVKFEIGLKEFAENKFYCHL